MWNSIKKQMKGLPSKKLAANGLMHHDFDALTPCQRECNSRFGMAIELEHEAYLSQHPEVQAMLELFICKMTLSGKKKDILKDAAEYFTRPAEVIDQEIRERLRVPLEGPYTKTDPPAFIFEDLLLERDLKDITRKHYPTAPKEIPSPYISQPNTPSSSFISVVSSDTTLPTPEPVPTPEATLSEIFFGVISNTVDKAIYSHVDDKALRYDTAYVELLKCVEEAMEIPVIEIREDIAELFYNAYKFFEMDIMEKERIAAEIAWEKRMRKKLKRMLRRMDNFKGYETPPTPKSVISSHESYKKPPRRPCECHPKINYNRYPKDRFGIYLPREGFNVNNITATPAISVVSLEEEQTVDKEDTKSSVSAKSGKSTKTTTFQE